MKTELKITCSMAVILMCVIGLLVSKGQNNQTKLDTKDNEVFLTNNVLQQDTTKEDRGVNSSEKQNITEESINLEQNDENKEPIEELKEEPVVEVSNKDVVFDGLTKEELVAKLNRNLKSTLENTGEIFANYAIELGIDPYLAVAIVLHETGCSWNCSNLVNSCYNVGGQKGSPTCGNGSYRSFNSLEEGIESFMYNLYNNYYAIGLTTPETMNTKYATSPVWYESINNYINKIKAS